MCRPGGRAIDGVDIAAIVDVHVVGLNRAIALPRAIDRDARLGRVRRHVGNEARDFLRLERIADIDDANAGVEVREHDQLLVERRVIGVGERVRAEPAAAMTEVAGLLGHLERRYGERRAFLGDVEDQQTSRGS